MSTRKWYEVLSAKIRNRNWEQIAEGWLDYMPDPSSCMKPPSMPLDRLPDFKTSVNALRGDIKYHITSDFAALRTQILTESLFSFVKAVNVLANTQLGLEVGYCSWSLSNAYHASYFFSKAIIGLLGITFTNVGKVVVVDAWQCAQMTSKEHRSQHCNSKSIYLVFPSCRNVEHVASWHIFARLLAKCDFPVQFGLLPRFLSNVQAEAFCAQRNDIHYKMPGWPFIEEQFSPSPRPGFARVSTSLDASMDQNDEDFSIKVALAIGSLAYLLLGDFARIGANLPDLEALTCSLQSDRHAIWREACRNWNLSATLPI